MIDRKLIAISIALLVIVLLLSVSLNDIQRSELSSFSEYLTYGDYGQLLISSAIVGIVLLYSFIRNIMNSLAPMRKKSSGYRNQRQLIQNNTTYIAIGILSGFCITVGCAYIGVILFAAYLSPSYTKLLSELDRLALLFFFGLFTVCGGIFFLRKSYHRYIRQSSYVEESSKSEGNDFDRNIEGGDNRDNHL